jgi:hypothetical protein
MSPSLRRTVAQWQETGYRGLRILRCPTCGTGTWVTWSDLGAGADEDVVAVAARVRCAACGQVPAGLAVVASIDGTGLH